MRAQQRAESARPLVGVTAQPAATDDADRPERRDHKGPRGQEQPEQQERFEPVSYLAEAGSGGRWLQVSPNIEQLLGFTATDFVSDATLWRRQLHPDDRDWVLRARAGVSDPGGSRLEYRMIRRDQRVIWVVDDVRLTSGDEHGAVERARLHDSTRRKRTDAMWLAHKGIVAGVARGVQQLDESLAEVAAATDLIADGPRCVIEVSGGDGTEPATVVCAAGPLGVADRACLAPTLLRVPFESPHGEPLGAVLLCHDDAGALHPADADLIAWSASLASLAVVTKIERDRAANSLSLLEATLESTADGILVVDRSGKIVRYNQKFVDMWQLGPVIGAGSGHEDRDLVAAVLGQLVDPDGFVRRIDTLYAMPEECSHDELALVDGRFYERYSQPRLVGGRPDGRVWSFRDMTLHRQLEHELRAQAFTDPLTSLANRALFMRELEAALGANRSLSGALAVLLLDLDDFKNVNDGLGHHAGDGMLIAVAERLQKCLRASDLAARLGGDEFVVMLKDLHGPQDAAQAAERILTAVSQPLSVDGVALTVRTSIGVAVCAPGDSASDALRNADLAMYESKRAGGGRCHVYESAMHVQALARLELKAELDRAVDTDAIVVHYQPVVDLRTARIVAVEALVRWRHPRRGLLAPSEFIPLAEETRAIDRLGRAVLAQACAKLAGWRRSGPKHARLGLHVNVSAVQLSDAGLIESVRQTLWRSGLPARALTFEITESSLTEIGVDALSVLRELRSLGISIALDDVGTGHSSLSHLVNYPLDLIKLDKSLVEQAIAGDAGAALMRAVVQLAEALSLATVVEGIENAAQLELVRSLTGALGQGYLLARPVTADQIDELLAGPGTWAELAR